jgi:hypothetical protein
MRLRLSHGAVAMAGVLLMLGGRVASAAPTLDGEWTGMMRTQQGRCPERADARLLVDGKRLSFVPSAGVLVLTGTIGADPRRLHAELMLSDMNHKPLPMVFEGVPSADGSRIDGTFGTPACRASVVLTRPARHPMQRLLGR